jgi:RNA polymerase sigma-70 factor (ECF subfamily)
MQKPDENPEAQLLKLAAQGDKQAFGTLYTQYLDEIFRFVYFKVGRVLTAEDITEDSFIKAWEYLPRLNKRDESVKNFRALLYRIANNLVIDHYRKRKPAENLDEDMPAQSPKPETVAIESQEIDQIAQALRKMKPNEQEIIILRLINDLPHKEAASIMKISENHARVLLHRALKKLRKIVMNDGGVNAENI